MREFPRHGQLKQAMFEKRFAVYRQVRDFLQKVSVDFKVGFQDGNIFANDVLQSKFLFDQTVQAFIEKIRKSSNRLHVVTEEYERGNVANIDEMNQLQAWFSGQAFTDADTAFAPDLKLY